VPKEHANITEAVIEHRAREAMQMLPDHVERTGRNVQAALLTKT
jgi:GntR family carbon starvation induced transcriptional regulator